MGSAIEVGLRTLFGLLPVTLFLVSLVYLDSYKLVRFRRIAVAILAGCGAAAIAFFLNSVMFRILPVPSSLITHFAAPVVEELLKALPIVLMIRGRKIGFLVDGGIQGFAIGTGFALVENVYYLRALADSPLLVWLIRGFGTAIMHGSTTAIFAIAAMAYTNRVSAVRMKSFLPGLGAAVVIHSLFNHFLISPLLSTVLVMIALPPLVIVVFTKSESYVRRWLGTGFDLDTELLRLLGSGELTVSPIGLYLKSLREYFPGEVLADMICYLRLHTELSLRAKGMLLMRESGFEVRRDPEIDEKLTELRYLDRSIGATGKLAISPFLHTRSQDLWQLSLLEKA